MAAVHHYYSLNPYPSTLSPNPLHAICMDTSLPEQHAVNVLDSLSPQKRYKYRELQRKIRQTNQPLLKITKR